MSNDIQRDCLQDRLGNASWWLCFSLAVVVVAAGGLRFWSIALLSVLAGYGLRYLISGRSD